MASLYDEYLLVFFLVAAENDPGIPANALRGAEIIDLLSKSIEEVLEAANVRNIARSADLSHNLYTKMLDAGVFDRIDDPVTGEYLQYAPDRFVSFRKGYLKDSQIYSTSRRVGGRFFPDVFSSMVQSAKGNVGDIDPNDGVVPASDRLVSLSHNQASTILQPAEELIDALQADNGIPDEPGFRERLLGQLRAGRELIKAGVFEARLFHLTMVVGLRMLVDRYKDHVIGALAAKLLDVIYTTIGDLFS